MDTIRAIRARRSEMNVPPSKKTELVLKTDEPEIFRDAVHFITRMAYAERVTVSTAAPETLDGLVSIVTRKAVAYIPLAELVDVAEELARIAREKEKAVNGLRITEGKLKNEKFVANAPEAVVNVEREKIAKYKELIARLEESERAMKG